MAYSKPAASAMLQDMKNIHPNWMCGVPRLWDSLAHGIFKQIKKRKQSITFLICSCNSYRENIYQIARP
ncbi:MAG: hypothetical protein WCR31_10710 [Treponema sp.]